MNWNKGAQFGGSNVGLVWFHEGEALFPEEEGFRVEANSPNLKGDLEMDPYQLLWKTLEEWKR